MTDARVSGQFFAQHPGIKDLGNQTHPRMTPDLRPVGARDAGRLLPAMLLRKDPLVAHLCRLRVPPDPEQAALFLLLVGWLVVVAQNLKGHAQWSLPG